MAEPDKADLAVWIDGMKLATENALTGEKNTYPVPRFIKNKMRAAVGLPEVEND